jgi:hypothetical protein
MAKDGAESIMQRKFRADLFEMIRRIVESEALAFSSFAEGEANIPKNPTSGNKDGWL